VTNASLAGGSPLRVAVLVKQVPRGEEMELDVDGTLRRKGVALEMNAYCRRAVSKGVELAAESAGECTVLTLGPLSADDVLREAIAWGAHRGVLVTDSVFAGSDSLATARALTAALCKTGPYDVILAGQNSVDADTGQVGPAVAELLELPFLAGVKRLQISGREIVAQCEHDDRLLDVSCELPAVLSCAERLCEPAKSPPEKRAEVSSARISRLTAHDLGAGPWGQEGSPTVVGRMRVHRDNRMGRVLAGPIDEQVRTAVQLLDRDLDDAAHGNGAAPENGGVRKPNAPASPPGGGPAVCVLIEPGRQHAGKELLAAAAQLADGLGGRVIAVEPVDSLDTASSRAVELGQLGAHEVVAVTGATTAEDFAAGLAQWCLEAGPFAIVASGTMWGRETSARTAARLGAGLIGDAVELGLTDGRLVAWKPAFGGQVLAAITARSAIQMVTVRPGVLDMPSPTPCAAPTVISRTVVPRSRVAIHGVHAYDELEDLAAASCVIGVGRGVEPDQYHLLDRLRRVLGAELGATRKVTDQGWLPHSRQIGITGRTIAPRLYIAIGTSGKFNHLVGVRRAGRVLAINSDPDAAVFAAADVGIVGDWRAVVAELAAALEARAGAPTTSAHR